MTKLTTIAPQSLAAAPNFLLVQDGACTINLNFIAEIDWESGNDDEATVTMITGTEYTIEGEDYHALRDRLGMDEYSALEELIAV